MRDVLLAGGQVDPAQRPSLAAKDAPDRGEELVLVQFVGPVKNEWLAKLQATGATVLGYAAQNGYIVHAAGDALDRVTELVGSYPAVRAATALRPADKVERGAESGRVAVQTVAGAPGADARAEAAGDGAQLAPDLSAVHVRTQFLDLTAAEVADLAADPAVVAIEPAGCRSCTTSGPPRSWPGISPATRRAVRDTTRGWRPKGFDISLRLRHRRDRLGPRPRRAPPPSTRTSPAGSDYAHDFTLDHDATDCGGHGTNVTSIAAGLPMAAGQDAQGYRYGLGVAPLAHVGASKIFRCSGAAASVNYTQLTSDAYAAGARISNNSWGISNYGGLPRRLAGLRRARPRRVRRAGQPGDGRGVLRRQRRRRSGQPGRPEGRRGLRQRQLAGHGEERDHGRRGRERARVRHRRLRRLERRRRQRRRHHQLLWPRPDPGRAPEARRGRARHAHHRRVAAARRLLGRGGLQPRLREQPVLLARVGHLAGRAARLRRGGAPPRLVRPHRRSAGAVAGHDEGDAREHRDRPRRR